MNYSNSSQILSKADNCFYVTLDSNLNIEGSNNKFNELFYKESNGNDKAFLHFFGFDDQSGWNSIFNQILNNNESVQNISAPVETERGKVYIEWTIAAVLDDEDVKGFEILGVFSKQREEKEITQLRTSLATQEKRFKSVLDKLKKVLNNSLDIICVLDVNGKIIRVSQASKTILGYEPRELVGKNFIDFVYKDDVARTVKANSNIKNGFITTNFENRYYRKDGSLAVLAWSSKWEEEDGKFYCIARDATAKKADEAVLKATQEKYKVIFNNHPFPMFIYDIKTYKIIEVNESAIANYGFSRNEFSNIQITQLIAEEDVKKFLDYYKRRENHYTSHKGIWLQKKKNNELFYAEVTVNFLEFQGTEAKLVLAIDRTEQIAAERELIKSNERYKFLSQVTFDAVWDADLKTNEVEWSEGVKKIFQTEDLSIMKKMDGWLNNLHSEDRERVESKLNKHLIKKESHWEDEYRFKTGENNYKYICARGYTIYDENNIPQRMIGAMQDLTERKAHEDMLHQLNVSLEKRARELAVSNAELERFAYVASHDLQEPLRMVTSFLQLLEKRYKDKLDQKAHEYIAYAVDGAERMKRLILDLLEYSRVNSSIIEKEDVDVNEVIDDLRLTYQNVLKETNGTITNQQLPLVKGNKVQILQLFQNLIGNAFKYRSDKPPAINVSYKEENNAYRFAVTDNGLGIDPKFFEKIFIIFQRLHNREQYSGTGIGLAICKKIIDKHGGKIWVTSTPGEGSTFYFTVPKYKYEQII